MAKGNRGEGPDLFSSEMVFSKLIVNNTRTAATDNPLLIGRNFKIPIMNGFPPYTNNDRKNQK